MNVVNITRHLHDGSITVNWIANEDLTWRHNDPEDQSRFKEIYENQDRVEFLIHPHPLHNPDLAQAGWVTSSYLMAFHNLGYRFILNSTLNQVRDYIKSSFEGYIKDNPLAHELDDFGVWVRSPEYPINPELLFMAPLENGKRVYLQVNCLAYEIRLPFRFRMSVLYPILIRSIPNFQARISELQEKKQVIHFPVPYNKMVGDKSWYDDLLGNPVLKGLGENENEPR